MDNCKCPLNMVPSRNDVNVCVSCLPDEYYDFVNDDCSLEKDNYNLNCRYEDSCHKCSNINEFCTKCIIRSSDYELVCLNCRGDLVYIHEEKKCRCGDGSFNFDEKST